MPSIDNGLLIPIISGIFAIAVGFMTHKLARSAQREMYPSQIIAHLQTQLTLCEEERDEARAIIRVQADYIAQLRWAIINGDPPPPPPWPEGLTQF